MPDLDQRLRDTLRSVANGLVPPETLDELAFRRLRRRLVRRRIAAGVVSAVVLAGIVIVPLALRDSGRDGGSVVAEPRRGMEWQRLPPAPIAGRDGHVAVWTGDEMIVWGGSSLEVVPTNEAGPSDGSSFDPDTGTTVRTRELRFTDGAAYSPARRSWRVMPATPIAITPLGAQAVWSGDEMLLFGFAEQTDAVAAAYSPEEDTWRAIASPPNELDGTAPSVVWTGSEMIVWGGIGGGGTDVLPRGAAYDPTSDQWRSLPDAPIGNRQSHSAVWTGTEMIVWGGTDLVGIIGQDEETEGAAYDPTTDTWRRLPPPPIVGRHWHEAIWTGEEMIIWAGEWVAAVNDGAAYDPDDDTWRPLAESPLTHRYWHTWTWADGTALAWGGYNFYAGEAVYANGARYDPTTDRWETLPEAPLTQRCQHSAVWTGDELILWGGTAHCGSYGARNNDGAALRLSDP